jgi:glyoxylase-like metal-dependent hydrolase (beta-lactamase superfamily II)
MIIRTLTAGPVGTNCYLVGCEQTQQAIVIDPAWNAPSIVNEATALGLTITLILITHAHFDHIGALADVKEATHAPVAMHPLEQDWLRLDGGAVAFGFRIRSVDHADIELAHGQAIDVGTLHFETRHTPGHTLGHVVFIDTHEPVAFVGDVLFAGSVGRTDLPGGDFDTLIDSITTQLLTLPDETQVYSGHGPPTTIGVERQTNPFL